MHQRRTTSTRCQCITGRRAYRWKTLANVDRSLSSYLANPIASLPRYPSSDMRRPSFLPFLHPFVIPPRVSAPKIPKIPRNSIACSEIARTANVGRSVVRVLFSSSRRRRFGFLAVVRRAINIKLLRRFTRSPEEHERTGLDKLRRIVIAVCGPSKS